MTEHRLKTWPDHFAAVWDGTKTFELRRDDRGFAVGDVLKLEEWDPATRDHTDRYVRAQVTYVLAGRDPETETTGMPALPSGLVVMSIKVVERFPAPPSPRENRRPRDAGTPSSVPFAVPSGYVGGTRDSGAPGPVFSARFDSECGEGDDIDEGDDIRMVDGVPWHAACWEASS